MKILVVVFILLLIAVPVLSAWLYAFDLVNPHNGSIFALANILTGAIGVILALVVAAIEGGK